jgi:pimeloyl-ACP methyl ester carboxylesterase
MLLLGARVAYSQFEAANPVKSPNRGPREFPNLADEIPILLARSAVFRDAWDRRSASYADDRFRSALLLAPGRSVLGFSRESLKQVRQPIRIIVGSGDTIAPAAECSAWLHRHVPSSELEILTSGAGHYVFLPEPTALGMKQASEVFPDADCVDRRRIHDHVSLGAARLFGGTA